MSTDTDFTGECDLCGEGYDMTRTDAPSLSEVGEFHRPDHPDGNAIAHAQCGFDAGLDLA